MTGVLSPYTADKQRSDQALQFLVKASEVLSSSLDLDFTMDALAWVAVPDLADWCSVSVVESSGARVLAMAHKDAAKVDAGRRIAEGHLADPGELARSLGLTSVLTVPLKAGAETLGEMTLAMIEKRVWSDADVALADELGSRAAAALQNARLYQEAVDARRAAEDANAAKVEFLARMSHELRTPLNAIGGFADLLAMGLRGNLTPQQSEDVRRIQRNQIHLQSLISDILNYAKLEVGRLEYDIRPTPVRSAVSAIEQVFSKQFDAAGLTWVADFDGPLWVLADVDKLQQIFMNLVGNSMKFTPSGGRIGIRGRARGEVVEVTITDSGPGIPAEKIEVIFEPFVQITRAGEVPTGTGLGLAIARDLARGMGGDLRAEQVASGASFVLRLPKAAR